MSQFSHPLRSAVPRVCLNKTKTLLYRFVYRGSQCHCAAEQQWRCTVLTVGKSLTQNAVDGCMTPITSRSTYNLRTINQLCCRYIHWHSH